MSRTNARKNAFYLIFQHDFVGMEGMEEAKNTIFHLNDAETNDKEFDSITGELDDNDKAFIDRTVDGTLSNLDKIDEIINTYAKGWSVNRMSKVDLAILRMAVYELKFSDETPAGVAINEAVEVAKKFSSDNSPSFVNGILGKIAES
ncbi:MAG: transcription antitermination factor NusB [Clostridia bacterium]|jgi:N utilization substance protein B|nr:transcription antitermination factor NusB [Clostridia bacterium]